ncbi:MAG: hypothetical protein IJX98_02570 [Clostridia bacterium]|nr:hypothetical protein [Clostridia bacterium]
MEIFYEIAALHFVSLAMTVTRCHCERAIATAAISYKSQPQRRALQFTSL